MHHITLFNLLQMLLHLTSHAFSTFRAFHVLYGECGLKQYGEGGSRGQVISGPLQFPKLFPSFLFQYFLFYVNCAF